MYVIIIILNSAASSNFGFIKFSGEFSVSLKYIFSLFSFILLFHFYYFYIIIFIYIFIFSFIKTILFLSYLTFFHSSMCSLRCVYIHFLLSSRYEMTTAAWYLINSWCLQLLICDDRFRIFLGEENMVCTPCLYISYNYIMQR